MNGITDGIINVCGNNPTGAGGFHEAVLIPMLR
jgi:hypothetical protein